MNQDGTWLALGAVGALALATAGGKGSPARGSTAEKATLYKGTKLYRASPPPASDFPRPSTVPASIKFVQPAEWPGTSTTQLLDCANDHPVGPVHKGADYPETSETLEPLWTTPMASQQGGLGLEPESGDVIFIYRTVRELQLLIFPEHAGYADWLREHTDFFDTVSPQVAAQDCWYNRNAVLAAVQKAGFDGWMEPDDWASPPWIWEGEQHDVDTWLKAVRAMRGPGNVPVDVHPPTGDISKTGAHSWRVILATPTTILHLIHRQEIQ